MADYAQKASAAGELAARSPSRWYAVNSWGVKPWTNVDVNGNRPKILSESDLQCPWQQTQQQPVR